MATNARSWRKGTAEQMTISDICPEVLKPCPICWKVPKLVKAYEEREGHMEECRKLECECKLLLPDNRTWHFDNPSSEDIKRWNEETYRVNEFLRMNYIHGGKVYGTKL